jgi:molybdate transport system substrate-binding protein
MKQTASSKHLVAQIFLIAGSARRWFFTACAVMGLALALAMAATPVMAQTGNGPPLVAAAANMQSALGELVPLFQRSSGGKVSLSIGSSANLVRQIQQGLPAELFLSADEDFALRLADAGLTTDRGVVYATGRIVLVAPKDSALKLDPQLAGLKDALTAQPNSVEKFAIANPELAPYGKAAIQALEKQGILPLVQPKLVIGENIAQTTQFISSGAAPAGITALALVLAPAVADRVRYALVASALHTPIRQRMVLLKTASPSARAFYDFLQSPAAKVVLKRYGYE